MRLVDGVNPMPVPFALDNDAHRAEITFAMVDALAALHDVDWQAARLGDLGRPKQFHERQVSRWTSQLASHAGRDLPGIDIVGQWLEANLPTEFDPTIMHSDFHMLNARIAADPPARVTAIVDWETATIGDPLLDLASFCEIGCSVAITGWPTRPEMTERYRIAQGLDAVPDLTYYEVLYNLRLAVLIEGSYQRSVRDPARSERRDLGDRVPSKMARAVDLVSSES
jgi:aminoglycoside phosphotransferase (APT) family kinase protein